MILSALIYYGFILPLSLMPLGVLYLISDLSFYLLYYLAPYRKRVVVDNLTRSFPDRSPKEIKKLTQLFYRHFCDLIMESFKAFSISKNEVLTRMKCVNPEIFVPYAARNQNVMVGGGHYGNFEWFGVAIDHHLPHQCACIYKPLSNPFFEKKLKSSREKYGLRIVAIKKVNEWLDAMKTAEKPQLLIYPSDQSPGSPSKAHWMRFLNQDTPAVFGLEKHSKKMGYPVFYGEIKKIKRGYFECKFSLITDHPENEPHGFITEEVLRRLEKTIVDHPQYWLWSHRRWKHKRPVEIPPP
jgi:KDO2-lipid IV(A) lauroyltransferase